MGNELGVSEAIAATDNPQPVTKKISLSDIVVAEPVLTALLRQWSSVEFSILENRKMRRQRVDTEALRAQGLLAPDGKYIGVRVIDNNITKDIPPYVSYFKQSRRQAVFKPVGIELPADIIQRVEDEYTRLVRYPTWEFDFIRWVDGAELHGYDWIEVVYDQSKPGRVARNHVGCIDLIYDLAVKDVQHSRVTLRRYKPTLVLLDELAQKNGFDDKVVLKLRTKIRESLGSVATESPDFHQDGSAVHIYKVMYKERGIVFSAWWCPLEAKTWLRKPRMFWNGVKRQETVMEIDPITGIPMPKVAWVRVPEMLYPYHVFRYRVTEDATIAQSQGRGEIDLHMQEVSCSIWSAYATMSRRSSNVMWAPTQPDPTVGGTAPKQLNVIVKDGAIWDRPMTNFTTPPPNPELPRALEMLALQNSDNLNQPAWAVTSRDKDRKTAKEITSADNMQAQISSTNVLTFSVAIQEVEIASWIIIQSQILQGQVIFYVSDDEQVTATVMQQQYQLFPAGDVDFIERNELAFKMQQDWPVVSTTPAGSVFLEEYLRVRYPHLADKFIKSIREGNIEKQLIQSMAVLLKTAVTEPNGSIKPEWAPHVGQLQQIQQQAQQVLMAPT